ncbi:MAG: YhgN family NAAT transporter [Spirochaetales bacterium]
MGIISAAVTITLVMDPLGNIPMFISVLQHVEESRRRLIIVREMIIALVLLMAFLHFGGYIMSALQISEVSLHISGGIVLFLIALRMIFPSSRATVTGDLPDHEPVIVPLATPLVAGPSAIATVMLLSTQRPDRMVAWTLALVIAWAVSFLVLVMSDLLRRRLGNRGLSAIERLMGMILVTLSIEMFMSGIADFAASLEQYRASTSALFSFL